MCGISAIISRSGLQIHVLERLNSTIKHRGPDDEGYFFQNLQTNNFHVYGGRDTPEVILNTPFDYTPKSLLETAANDAFHVGLGHRRLSIIDTSPAGHNPLSYDNNRYWITFNGEIYNYQELKQELKGMGYLFSTQTDTEVLVAAYKAWGEACLHRFVGMWAFVIYDRHTQEVFAARDRYGIKPLYYCLDPESNVYFASEIKQFTQLPHWKAWVNGEKCLHYLIYSTTDHTDETMFNSVFHIPTGSYFKTSVGRLNEAIVGNKLRTTKWYIPQEQPFKGSKEDAVAQFRQLLLDAVSIHLRSDVPIGSALSGGLDSSSIVCIVNDLLKRENAVDLQKTFSSCSIYDRFDERPWMEKVVESIQVDAHYIYPKVDDVFTKLSEMIWHHDVPYDSQSAFLGYHVFELAKKNNVKVLLNGQGADEYLGGYSQFIGPLIWGYMKDLNFTGLSSDLKKARAFHSYSNAFLYDSTVNYLVPRWMKSLKAKRNILSNPILKDLEISKVNYKHIRPYDCIPENLDSLQSVSRLYTFYNPLTRYLRWEDRNSMAHSIEARVPFLDHRLVEFAYNLPVNYVQSEGQTKWILREAMKGILPESIRLRRDKKGFVTPEAMWVKKENPALFREKLTEAVESSNGFIKSTVLTDFDKMIAGNLSYDKKYWRYILFGAWMKQFNVNF